MLHAEYFCTVPIFILKQQGAVFVTGLKKRSNFLGGTPPVQSFPCDRGGCAVLWNNVGVMQDTKIKLLENYMRHLWLRLKDRDACVGLAPFL